MKDPEKNNFLEKDKPEDNMRIFLFVHELFRRYYHGESGEKEKEIIESWGAKKLKKRKTGQADTNSADPVWQSITEKLQFPREAGRKTRIIPRTRRYASLYKYAAILLFGFLLAGVAYYQFYTGSDVRVQTSYDATNQVEKEQLADGTTVYLNQDSKLILSFDYNQRTREVWLRGEAFFEVAKNPEKPFIIHHGQLQTIVKGTVFNIKAYPELSENVVTVKSGVVEVRGEKGLLGTLIANQQLIYNNLNGENKREELRWEDAAGWINGELILNYANADELKLRIRQFYGMDLEVRGNILENMRMRSVFMKGTPVDDVMKSICGLYGLTYKLVENKILLYK